MHWIEIGNAAHFINATNVTSVTFDHLGASHDPFRACIRSTNGYLELHGKDAEQLQRELRLLSRLDPEERYTLAGEGDPETAA